MFFVVAVVVAGVLILSMAFALIDEFMGKGSASALFLVAAFVIAVNMFGLQSVLSFAGIIIVFVAITAPIEWVKRRREYRKAEECRAAQVEAWNAERAQAAIKEQEEARIREALFRRLAGAHRSVKSAYPHMWETWQINYRPGWHDWDVDHVEKLRPFDRIVTVDGCAHEFRLVCKARVRNFERTDPVLVEARKNVAREKRKLRAELQENRLAAVKRRREQHAAKRAEQHRIARANRIRRLEELATVRIANLSLGDA